MVAPWFRNAASALSGLALATALGAVMIFLAQTFLARRLGPPAYGLFASSLATVTMVAPLAGFGLSQFRLRAYGAEGWGADRWLRPSLQFSAMSTTIALAIVWMWALRGGPVDSDTRTALMILSPVIVGTLAVELVSSKLRLEERYGQLAVWLLITPAGRLTVAALVLAVPTPGMQLASIGYCLVAFTTIALAVPPLRALFRGEMHLRGHGARLVSPPASPRVRDIWSEAWSYGVAAALYPVFFQVGTVLLKYLAGDAQAGRYGIAMAVMSAIYLLPATVYQKFLLSKLHRWAVHERDRFWRVHRLGSIAMLSAGAVVGLLLAISSRFAVPVVFGEGYHEVADVLVILALCVPLRFLSTAVGSALLTPRHMRYRVAAMATAALAALLLNVLLIPSYAETGAAMATVLAEALLLAAMYVGVRRFHADGGEQ